MMKLDDEFSTDVSLEECKAVSQNMLCPIRSVLSSSLIISPATGDTSCIMRMTAICTVRHMKLSELLSLYKTSTFPPSTGNWNLS